MDITSPRRLVLLVSVLLFFHSLVNCQDVDPPMTWGEIDRADLEMTSFPADTNASVVVLCDYGTSFVNNDLDIVYQRHLRVKILTEGGFGWGTRTILVDKEDQYIDDIEAVTYVLNESGEVEEYELDDDDIFTEEVSGDFRRYRFTLPGLKRGCVIEVRYTTVSEGFWSINDWYFQFNEPVRWSEYRLRHPKAISYAAVMQGYYPFHIKEQREVKQLVSGMALAYLRDQFATYWESRWVVKDAPAIRDEPYVTTVNDYQNKVEVQLAGYAFPTGGRQKVLDSWTEVGKRLSSSKRFGKRIEVTRRIQNRAEELTRGLSSPVEKTRAIHDWIVSSITWDGTLRITADQDVDEVLETKKGSNAEITFLLLSLLKSAGIEGDPVIVSTRSHGKIQELYPIVDQFNYALARVHIADEKIFLDATNPARPMELLGERVLNVRGLVVKKDGIEWVTLSSQGRSKETSVTHLELIVDGSIKGTLTGRFEEYACVDKREDLISKRDVDVVKESYGIDISDISIDSLSIQGRQSNATPLTFEVWITAPSYAQATEDMIYLNPHIPRWATTNPFKTTDRNFPVDYGHGIDLTSITYVLVPDDYEVKEKPSDRLMALGQDAVYKRVVAVKGRQIQMMRKFQVRKVVFPPLEYSRLREFYNNMVETEQEQVVLQRKPEPTSTEQDTGPTSTQAVKGNEGQHR